jgi:hypothetical protein
MRRAAQRKTRRHNPTDDAKPVYDSFRHEPIPRDRSRLGSEGFGVACAMRSKTKKAPFGEVLTKVVDHLQDDPPLVFAIGAAIVLVAAGALASENLRILTLPLLAVLIAGLVAHLFLAVRLGSEPRLFRKYGITIDDPKDDAPLGPQARVKGRYRRQPPPGTLRLFTRTPDGTHLWPQDLAQLYPDEGRWEATVYLGGAPKYRMDIVAALAGRSTRILCEYYAKTGKDLKTAGRLYVPLGEMPVDFIEQKSVHVERV